MTLYDIAITLTRSQKRAILLALDLLWIAVAYLLARLLILGWAGLDVSDIAIPVDIVVALVVGGTLTAWVGLHRVKLNAYEMQGVIETAFVAVSMVGAGLLANLVIFGAGQTHPEIFVSFGMFFLILAVGARLCMREILLRIYRDGKQRQRVLIYGAGQTGQQLAAALATDDALQAVAFVDDNPTLQSLSISGFKVYSPSKIKEIVAEKNIDRVVLAMPSVNQTVRSRIQRRLRDIGCDVYSLPSFADMVAQKSGSATSSMDITKLMGRNRLEEELPGVSEAYDNRRVLVTGAGGSIGSELCRQIIDCDPACLVLLDHSEHALYRIERELRDIAPEIEVRTVLGTICEPALVEDALRRFDIDVVLHAAAYKHLPLVEDNPIEGMRNNVIGTKVLADAARAHGVERFILISSDKAVRPSSTMGASKRLAELVIQDLATRSPNTRFSMVRFGNVLGSSGSVVPLFEEQIARGGPVTVTHADVTRYFMTVSEAVRLVLLAGSFARGGDVFVLDMGKPVPIRDVAFQMIEGAGLTVKSPDNPRGDIEIQITGLRPGEKLHEELLIGTDMLTTPHSKILRAQESSLSEIEMANALQSLRRAIDGRDTDALNALMDQWVETGGRNIHSIVNE